MGNSGYGFKRKPAVPARRNVRAGVKKRFGFFLPKSGTKREFREETPF